MGLGLALALLLAAPAVAQQPQAPGGSKAPAIAGNKGDISFGYAYTSVTAKGSGVREKYNTGWTFSAAKRVNKAISLVAALSGLTGSNINDLDLRQSQTPSKFFTYEGGIRFSTEDNAMASGKRMMFKPFAEFLYGGSNDNAVLMNHMSVMHVSGGVDLQMSNHASIRIQGSAPFWFFFGPTHIGAQLQVGLVVPFAK